LLTPATAIIHAPHLGVSSATHDFGSVDVDASDTWSATISNLGHGDLVISGVNVAGTGFSISDDGCNGETLGNGDLCEIELAFSPTEAGGHAGKLDIGSNNPSSPDAIALTGFGVAASVSTTVSPVHLDFGEVVLGDIGSAQTVTVTNDGAADATLSAVASEDAAFAVSNDSCSGQSVAMGDSCTFDVEFVPAGAGAVSATIAIPSDAADGGSLVSVAGVGSDIMGLVTSVDSVSLGEITLGGRSAAALVSVTNPDSTDVVVTGATSDDSALIVSGTPCAGQTLAPGSSCTFRVSAEPIATGAFAATVTVESDSPAAAPTVAVDATSILPALQWDTDFLLFEDTPTLGMTDPETIVLENAGDSDVTVDEVQSVEGAFTIVEDDCSGETLAPGATCTVQVAFTPTAEGALRGSIYANTDGGHGTFAMMAEGVGLPAEPAQDDGDEDGCGCSSGSERDMPAGLLVLLGLGVAAGRRMRRR
jgi:MYXO-CTERM domain-containing protein